MPENFELELFSLRRQPHGERPWGVALWHVRQGNGVGGRHMRRLVVRVWGAPLRALSELVVESLRRAGHRVWELSPGTGRVFPLREEEAVRLALAMLAAKPLQKPSKLEAVVEAVGHMTPEEVYYWYAKCTTDGTGPRARRALRILLAGG